MRKCLWILSVFWLAQGFPAAQAQVPPLPAPVSNNAVASLKIGKHEVLFSFMGIGAKKTWDTIANTAYSLDPATGKWIELRAVPGPAGRIGASAIGAREQVFLLGGYVLDGQEGEITVSDVSVYETEAQRWYRGEDEKVEIDD